jgi:hypothetical protein
LALGVDVFYTDMDVLWRLNALQAVQSRPDFLDIDIFVSEHHEEAAINTGVLYIKSNVRTRVFFSTFLSRLGVKRVHAPGDQVCVFFPRATEIVAQVQFDSSLGNYIRIVPPIAYELGVKWRRLPFYQFAEWLVTVARLDVACR